jgi:hypothetical protein
VSAPRGYVQGGLTLRPTGRRSWGTDVESEIEHETNGGGAARTREIRQEALIPCLEALEQSWIARDDTPGSGFVRASARREEDVVVSSKFGGEASALEQLEHVRPRHARRNRKSRLAILCRQRRVRAMIEE